MATVRVSIRVKAAIEPPPPPETSLSVELALSSGTLIFNQDQAVNLGDYVGQFVHQRCLMQRQGAWTVFFRLDFDNSRQEIVVEYGGYDFSVSPAKALVTPSHILSSYIATIKQGEVVLATVTVPKQYWLTRWRWQLEPRPIVRTHDDLVSMKAILPLDNVATWNNPPDFSLVSATWSGPMGTAGIYTAMGTTGDRQEIGPITNLQGSYLVRDNETAKIGMLAQAEAVGSFPFWVRDGNNLLDVYERPYQGMTSATPTKYLPLAINPPAGDGNYFQLDTAHFPSIVYIPWLLTDDPYFLEGAQMSAIYAVIQHNYGPINRQLIGLANTGQKRGWAWGVRNILQMAALAPENVPSWLQPRSYFRKIADDNLNYTQRHMTSQVKACRIFHMVTGVNASIDPWQEAYLLSVMGWVRWTRLFPEWDTAIDWMAHTLLRTTDDPALGGWDRRWPAVYRIILNRMRKAAVDKSIPLTNIPYDAPIPEPYSDETPDSWGELWNLYRQRMVLEGTPLSTSSEDKILTTGGGGHYLEAVLGALAALALGGTIEALEHADWIRSKAQVAFNTSGHKSSFRYAYQFSNVS